MDQDRLRTEMRLAAIEFVLCQTFAMVCADLEKTPAEINKIHKSWLARLKKTTPDAMSPMFSDLAESELDYAVRCMISMQREMLSLPKRLDP
jgi:hypothetical protein